MKKFAKVVRIVTIAPVSAIMISLLVYFCLPSTFNSIYELLLMIFIIGMIPTLAYPIQRYFKIFQGDPRSAERKLAFIFSIAAYTLGALIAIVHPIPEMQKIIYFTYFFSGLIMCLTNFGLRVKASGHMCGIAGPIAIAIYFFGYQYLFLMVILILVGWSSLKLKRHSFQDLVVGFIIPIISLAISILIIK